MSLQSFILHLRRGLVSANLKCYAYNTLRCSSTVQQEKREKWDLVSSVCVERKPVITPELNDIEKRFSKLLAQMEFENSLLSDHELRHKQDIKQAELLKKGEDTDVEQALKQTAQDFEDACQEEFSKLQFAPRVSEADTKKDVKSLKRKLDRNLLLIVEQTLGGKKTWALPQGVRNEGETLRQAAERVLREHCGGELKARFLGNAPCGFYKYKYPRDVRGSVVGAKVFFYKAQYVQGQVATGEKVSSYKWLGRDELEQSLHKDYCRSVKQFLVDEH